MTFTKYNGLALRWSRRLALEIASMSEEKRNASVWEYLTVRTDRK